MKTKAPLSSGELWVRRPDGAPPLLPGHRLRGRCLLQDDGNVPLSEHEDTGDFAASRPIDSPALCSPSSLLLRNNRHDNTSLTHFVASNLSLYPVVSPSLVVRASSQRQLRVVYFLRTPVRTRVVSVPSPSAPANGRLPVIHDDAQREPARVSAPFARCRVVHHGPPSRPAEWGSPAEVLGRYVGGTPHTSIFYHFRTIDETHHCPHCYIRMATPGVTQPGSKRNRFLMKTPEVRTEHKSARIVRAVCSKIERQTNPRTYLSL